MIYTVPQVILNDGTILEDSSIGYSDHKIWCWIKGVTMAEAFALFSDSGKTSVIKHRYGTKEEIYTNFTTMTLIKVSEFTVDIRMEGIDTSVDIHDIPEE